MKRKIVRIDEEKCDGCGLCVSACAEGAIELVDGKARLVSDVYCDGLGACIGDCPQDAITIEEREAEAFDEEAVMERLRALQGAGAAEPMVDASHPGPVPIPGVLVPPADGLEPAGHGHGHGHGHGAACPGSALRTFDEPPPFDVPSSGAAESASRAPAVSRLGHWPVQIMLVPPHAPFLRGADLLVCADCVPFVVPDFHERYLAGRAVLVGCPKLDDLAYYHEKLAHIVAVARPARVTVLRMEVPCCGGIAQASLRAVQGAGLGTPVEVHTIGVRGDIRVEKLSFGRQAG